MSLAANTFQRKPRKEKEKKSIIHTSQQYRLCVSTGHHYSTVEHLVDIHHIPQTGQYPACNCYRPQCFIACLNPHCNFSCTARIRKRCPSHPNVTFLHDLPQCPKCLGPLKEYPMNYDSDDL